MSNGTYKCLCKNSIFLVDARFRSYGANGKQYDQVKVKSGSEEHLKLAQASGNTVLVEYYDLDWIHDGCYSVNNGDTIDVNGSSRNFQVQINGKNASRIDCPAGVPPRSEKSSEQRRPAQ